jgi:hypothetical protein
MRRKYERLKRWNMDRRKRREKREEEEMEGKSEGTANEEVRGRGGEEGRRNE